MKFVNASEALSALAWEILRDGTLVAARGQVTRELRHLSFSLSNPLDRSIVVAGRRNSIFAAIAESVWVLAGRNDVAFLEPYLPRASEFSDDGVTWRAGYGPRLRSWGGGVDQFAGVRDLLLSDPTSRRAVMSIFDPAVDFAQSKDIPCTNWMSFSIRDGALDMAVTIRSNDLIWGFSGINSFEWSLLQEVMAFWVRAEVGQLHFFVGSMHVYERHFSRLDEILASSQTKSQWTKEGRSAFSTPAEKFSARLSEWFDIEASIRVGEDVRARIDNFSDALLADYLRATVAFWTFRRSGRGPSEAALADVHDPSLASAGMDYFAWISGDRPPTSVERRSIVDYLPAIVRLHRAKDAMYGDSWKKRGEQMAVLANIARKLDRLLKYVPGAGAGVESWFETAVDLFIYTVKYKTFLLDELSSSASPRLSDGHEGFERVIADQNLGSGRLGLQAAIDDTAAAFQTIEVSASRGEDLGSRLTLVDALIAASARVVESAVELNPRAAAAETMSWPR